jgi:hypothetical protein
MIQRLQEIMILLRRPAPPVLLNVYPVECLCFSIQLGPLNFYLTGIGRNYRTGVEFPPLGGTPCGGFHRAGIFHWGEAYFTGVSLWAMSHFYPNSASSCCGTMFACASMTVRALLNIPLVKSYSCQILSFRVSLISSIPATGYSPGPATSRIWYLMNDIVCPVRPF